MNTFRRVDGHPIAAISLIPSGGGRFEVTIDDELVYSKLATRRHATGEEICELVRQRLGEDH